MLMADWRQLDAGEKKSLKSLFCLILLSYFLLGVPRMLAEVEHVRISILPVDAGPREL